MKKIITLLKSLPLLSMMGLANDWKGFIRLHFLHALNLKL